MNEILDVCELKNDSTYIVYVKCDEIEKSEITKHLMAVRDLLHKAWIDNVIIVPVRQDYPSISFQEIDTDKTYVITVKDYTSELKQYIYDLFACEEIKVVIIDSNDKNNVTIKTEKPKVE